MEGFILSDEIGNYPQIRFMKEFMVGHPGFIAGGCFKSAFSGEKPHDLDMFFRDRSEYKDAVNYFDKHEEEYVRGYQNSNVESFVHLKTKVRIECIRKIFGPPKEVLSQFDFTIAKFAFYTEVDPPEDEDGDWNYTDFVIYHPHFFEHLSMKRLVVDDKMPFPISTFNRTYKYALSGFMPCRETKSKIINAIRNLPNFTDAELAKSFYEGVD